VTERGLSSEEKSFGNFGLNDYVNVGIMIGFGHYSYIKE
jgi:hypothetical protein